MKNEVKEILFSEAISEALVQSMEIDSNVFIMGAGVDDAKGLFGTTLSAYEQFGGNRVFDIPLSENTITGVAVGSSLSGTRPVLVHARNDFLMLTMDQIVNNAAKMRYMFGGKITLPLTIMTSTGAGTASAAQHSETLYSLFAHFPGLTCLAPSDAYTAKGLFISAIRSDDPVIIFNHKLLMGRTAKSADIGEGEGFGVVVPEEMYEVPIGKAHIDREGTDITLVGISYTTIVCRDAARELESQGYSVEVIDLLSVSPLDSETILNSVKKTRGIVIVDEDYPRCSVASDISALVAEEAFDYLDAPPVRITSPHTPVPYSLPLEMLYLPSKESVVEAALGILE